MYFRFAYSGEKFTKKDIITLNDPTDVSTVKTFLHVKEKEKKDKQSTGREKGEVNMKDGQYKEKQREREREKETEREEINREERKKLEYKIL